MSAGRKAILQRARGAAAGWLAVCSVITFVGGCSLMRDKNPNERTTGDVGTLVRARFNVTIWDSNGDSRTTTVTDAEMYDRLFARLNAVITSAQ